jgi:rhodanese-related sulfurtransferase
LSPQQVEDNLGSQDINIVDLRDTSELIENGVIPGSYHASRGHLEFFADPDCEYYKDFFNKDKSIILYCHSGARSALAAKTLQLMGYDKISHMKGGFKSWMKEVGIIVDYK